MLINTGSLRCIVQISNVFQLYFLLKAGLLEFGYSENILQKFLVCILHYRKGKSEALFYVTEMCGNKTLWPYNRRIV